MLKTFFQEYTNLFGTVAAIASAITVWLAEQGCISQGDLAATCSIPWLPASLMPIISGIFIAALLIGKLLRPGGLLHSLFGSTAVVVESSSVKSGPGTVTPSQVASK